MILRSSLLTQQQDITHGFTTKLGYPSDLSDPDATAAWIAVADALGVPDGRVAVVRQVHGADVLEVCGDDVPDARRCWLAGEADALVCASPGLLIAVRTADCVPILVAGQGAVAAIHAGWRGLASGVIPAAMAALERLGAGPWRAAVGPCIGTAAYEVGQEVIDGISARVPTDVFVRPGPRRAHADLAAAAAWQLQQAGVAEVDVLGLCTFTDDRLHSFRRGREPAGRQAAVIGLLR